MIPKKKKPTMHPHQISQKKVSQEYRLVKIASQFALQELDEDPMRHQVILDYIPLIRYIAQKLAMKLPSNIDLDDLYSSGVIGLMDAINKYDPSRDNKFKTYAEFRIRGSMLDELRAQDWVPRSVREYKKREERIRNILETELGRPAIQKEVADKMELSLEEYQNRLGRAHVSLVSLDDLGTQQGSDRDRISLMECVPHPSEMTPYKKFTAQNMQDVIMKSIDSLPEKQRLVLSLYYYEDLNLKEIGRILEVTESRVSQLHTQAITKIKTKLSLLLGTEEEES